MAAVTGHPGTCWLSMQYSCHAHVHNKSDTLEKNYSDVSAKTRWVMYIPRGVCVPKYTAAELLYNSLDKLSSLEFQIRTPTTTHRSVTGYTKMSKKWNTVWQNLQTTEATTKKDWITINYRLQHAIIGMAAHEYHHNSCHIEQLHLPKDVFADCVEIFVEFSVMQASPPAKPL